MGFEKTHFSKNPLKNPVLLNKKWVFKSGILENYGHRTFCFIKNNPYYMRVSGLLKTDVSDHEVVHIPRHSEK